VPEGGVAAGGGGTAGPGGGLIALVAAALAGLGLAGVRQLRLHAVSA
jgi:hypothetical protein